MIAALSLLVALSCQAPTSKQINYDSIPYKRLIRFKPGMNMATSRFWVDQLIDTQPILARGPVSFTNTAGSQAMANELYRALDIDLTAALSGDPENTPVGLSTQDQFARAMLFWAMGSGRYWGMRDYARLSLVADTAFQECLSSKRDPLTPSLRRLAELAHALNMRVFNGPKAEARLQALSQQWEHDDPHQAFVASIRLAEIYWHTGRQSEATGLAESTRKRFPSMRSLRLYSERLDRGFWRDHFYSESVGPDGEHRPAVLNSDGFTMTILSHDLQAKRDQGIVLVPFEPAGAERLLEEVWFPTDVMPKHFEDLAQHSERPELAPYVIYDRRTGRFFPRDSGFEVMPLQDPLAVEASRDISGLGGMVVQLSVRHRPYWRFEPNVADRQESGSEFLATVKIDSSGQLIRVHGQKLDGDFIWGPWPKYVLKSGR